MLVRFPNSSEAVKIYLWAETLGELGTLSRLLHTLPPFFVAADDTAAI